MNILGNTGRLIALVALAVLIIFFAAPDSTIHSEDIGDTVESAIKLIGPEDSHAAYNRMDLENRIADYYSGLWPAIAFGVALVPKVITNWILGADEQNSDPLRRIAFADGTSIQFKLIHISPSFGGLTVMAEVLPETAELPDGQMVPQEAGRFYNFSYSGDAMIVDALANLARRYGIPVSGSGDGSLECSTLDVREEKSVTCMVLP